MDVSSHPLFRAARWFWWEADRPTFLEKLFPALDVIVLRHHRWILDRITIELRLNVWPQSRNVRNIRGTKMSSGTLCHNMIFCYGVDNLLLRGVGLPLLSSIGARHGGNNLIGARQGFLHLIM